MAKLGKQKFSLTGEHNSNRTTFAGVIEMYLQYDTEGDFFYFDTTEMKKYLKEDSVSPFSKSLFGDCNTKDKAIGIIELLISNSITETRKLRIEIGMNSELYKVPNPLAKEKRDWSADEVIINPDFPTYLKDMLSRGGMYKDKGITLNFERVMEVELNGIKLYGTCDKDWKYERKNLYSNSGNLIEWTLPAEEFLMDTQNKLDAMCKVILDFFNAGEKVENLLSKMTVSTNLLTEK